MSPTDLFVEKYKTLAGLAAEFELRIRLIAGVTPELKSLQYEKLEILEPAVFSHFSQLITPEEKEFLTSTRTLRNKIMHSDFKALKNKLETMLGRKVKSGGSFMLRISDGSLKKTEDASKKEGGIFAWLLECSTGNVFEEASDIFILAKKIYQRVAYHQATKDIPEEDLKRMKELGVIAAE